MSVVDQEVRDRALDIRGSFAVSAPAGSGKTGLLVRRILKLLATSDSPEQVLAITFTRKAAAEMQERILNAIGAARSPEPPTDDYQRAIWEDARAVLARDREMGWELMATPARLRIMTIDSLCRHVARQMAVETALGELPEPTEQPEVFYREAIRGFFRNLDRPGAVGDHLALLLEHLDNNLATLESLLESLLAKREQWLEPLMASRDARSYLEHALQNTIAETLAMLRQALLIAESDLVTLANYAADNLVRAGSDSSLTALAGLEALPGTEPTAANLALWEALAELLITKSNAWRAPKGLTKSCGFPTKNESVEPENARRRKEQLGEVLVRLDAEPGLLQLLVDLRNLPGPVYSDAQWQLLEALTHVLPLLVAELSVLFKTRHACDFTEVTLAALSALGSEEATTDVSLKLDYQIAHILVDEFQDTSSLQFRLLKLLTRGWEQGDGRTLFVVGDGMQSLYGFRNANVGIFLEARKLPVGDIRLEPLDLQVNFRSDRELVDWVNCCFADIFPQREDVGRGAVRYAEAAAANCGTAGCAVSVDAFHPEAETGDEAERVIALIRRAQQADPEGTIAILVRARSHLRHLIPALQREGIGWEATDIDPLASRMPVIDLHSLTRALLNPADRIAWLAVLRAPWCGLNLKDLHTLATGGRDGARDLPWVGGQLFSRRLRSALSPDGQKRLERVSEVLAAGWRQRLRKPLRQWVEGTWLALGGPATLLDSHEMAWCQQYLDLLEVQASGGELEEMAQFTTALDKLFANPPPAAGNPVQIMTIHKSKGLEFDTVILPCLHKGGAPSDSELLYWRERVGASGEPELLISPLLSPLERANGDESRLVNHLKYERKLKGALEDARVLYVACTRAIKRLHLLYTTPKKNPTSGSLLGCFWPALENSAGAGAEHRDHSEAITQEAVVEPDRITFLGRLRADWRHPFRDRLNHTAATAPAVPIGLDGDEDGAGRHIGTVLHRTLGRIVNEGVECWDDDRVERQRRAWELQLRQLAVADTEPAVATLARAVRTILADETGRWLLSPAHAESACELAIGHLEGSDSALSVIDRTFVEDHVRWIVDYKSAEPRPGEPAETFLIRQVAAHREQLERYRSVFGRREPAREIRTALYFPLLGHFEIVNY